MSLAKPKILIAITQRLCLMNKTDVKSGTNERNLMCCMLGLITNAWAAGPTHVCGVVNINEKRADGLKGACFTVMSTTFPPLGSWDPR